MSRQIPICDLARIILPQGRGVIAVLGAYFDMSATKNEPIGITSVAGYVAPEDEWKAVEDKWRDALDYWRIDAFHFSQMPNLVGHERTLMATAYFANIIKESNLDAIGAALVDEHWHCPDWGSMTTKRRASPYHQCLDSALRVLLKHAKEFYPDENIAVICDSDALENGIVATFNEHKEKCDRLATITVGRTKQHIGLQCADLAAGKLRKSWLGIAKNELVDLPWGEFPARRKPATSFWSLTQGKVLSRALILHASKRRISS